jgi:hypothetical protein
MILHENTMGLYIFYECPGGGVHYQCTVHGHSMSTDGHF